MHPMPYSSEIVFIADQRVLAIPIVENHEPLVDLINEGGIVLGPSPEIPNNTDYTKMRKCVYEKLMYAQSLLPKGLKFCLYEGYRSLSLQKQLFEERYRRVENANPGWSHKGIFVETTKLVSPLINLDGSKNIPPHSTGGAIDVYLLNDNGECIDMGMHPKDWMEDLEGLISKTVSAYISKDAQTNRNIMSNVLLEAGFANYPTEFWHWSYGDRYWAYQTGNNHAIYGSV